jgi:hypothetical protein
MFERKGRIYFSVMAGLDPAIYGTLAQTSPRLPRMPGSRPGMNV